MMSTLSWRSLSPPSDRIIVSDAAADCVPLHPSCSRPSSASALCTHAHRTPLTIGPRVPPIAGFNRKVRLLGSALLKRADRAI